MITDGHSRRDPPQNATAWRQHVPRSTRPQSHVLPVHGPQVLRKGDGSALSQSQSNLHGAGPLAQARRGPCAAGAAGREASLTTNHHPPHRGGGISGPLGRSGGR